MNKKVQLFTVREDVRCISCNHIGAIQFYGSYYPSGMGDNTPKFEAYEKYRNNPHMSPAMGFGGTIPFQCTNCKEIGLIDFDGLEGYSKRFEVIK